MTNLYLLYSRWTGRLGRPLTGNFVAVPHRLQLRGARLHYSAEGRLKRVEPARLLDRFIALADAGSPERDILDFATRYGPLYLCEPHGLASYHKPLLMTFTALGPSPIFGIDEPFKYQWCQPRIERRRPEILSEPMERYRALARRARDLLLVASAVRLEGDAPPELWTQTDGFEGSFAKQYGPSWAYLDEPWPRLAANLDYWVVAADVSVRVSAQGRSLDVGLNSNRMTCSAFALVAVQLLLAVTRSEGLATCSGCAAPFMSQRQPLAGKRVGHWLARRNYCQDCRDAKVPQRDAARDYRRRRAAKQRSTMFHS